MNEISTQLMFILDKSGSMCGLEHDTIGGFNALLAKQKALDSACLLTTVLFSDSCEVLHQRVDIHQVEELTEETYQVGGSTALLDAIGRTLASNVQQERTEKVLVVIITDGQENSSTEYSLAQVRRMIEKRQAEGGWEFLFLGAGLDVIAQASAIGIRTEQTRSYTADSEGVEQNFSMLSEAVSSMRAERSQNSPRTLH
ncbi:vWA domain-containing protein [Sphaerochaeta sp.]|uniref:vWA domain-containing protein n=1 Tax=Sphaerochaeta sp. TaxID=1972642 RepID=UPI003D10CF87